MNAQLKYADRRRSRVAVIQGSNERNAPGGPQVTIRDLKLGAELAKTTKDRADYLELRQRAHFPRPRRSWSSGCARSWRGKPRDNSTRAPFCAPAAGASYPAKSPACANVVRISLSRVEATSYEILSLWIISSVSSWRVRVPSISGSKARVGASSI